MTQDELIDLSIAAAKVAGIDPVAEVVMNDNDGGHADFSSAWLYEDGLRCFELMCRYKLEIHYYHLPMNTKSAMAVSACRTNDGLHAIHHLLPDPVAFALENIPPDVVEWEGKCTEYSLKSGEWVDGERLATRIAILKAVVTLGEQNERREYGGGYPIANPHA